MLSQAASRQSPRRVLLLGGWSPGPLYGLSRSLRQSVEFIEAPIPTPPAGVTWLYNPHTLTIAGVVIVDLFLVAVGLRALASGLLISTLLCIAAAVGSLVLILLLVRKFVQYSIRRGSLISTELISKYDIDCVVGFSWGGGVLYDMKCNGVWDGPAVLLAPTISAMEFFTGTSMGELDRPAAENTVCVHAEGDPFTPMAQVDRLDLAGCRGFEVISDSDHTLSDRHAQERIVANVKALLELED